MFRYGFFPFFRSWLFCLGIVLALSGNAHAQLGNIPGASACVSPGDPVCISNPLTLGCALAPCMNQPGPGGQTPFCNLNPTAPGCQPGGGYQPGLPPITPYPPTYPGVGGGYRPTDPNGRPIVTPAHGVPAEFDCPLFENRPHQELIIALDLLNSAMYSTPSCQQQRGSWDVVQRHSETIRSTITSLQSIAQNPTALENNPRALADFEAAVTAAISAADSLSGIFGNNELLRSQCGREMMGTGRVLLAFNDILNNLAPFALMAVAMNPAAGLALKFAVTGGAMVTSSISTMVRMIDQGTVDMTNPDNRKALLRNTCQFTKVARKARFMQLAQSGRIQQITDELDESLEAYRTRYSSLTPTLRQTLQQIVQLDQQVAGVDRQIRKDLADLLIMEAQLEEAKNDELYVCLIAQEYVRRAEGSSHAAIFPQSVFANLESAVSLTQTDPDDARVRSVQLLNQSARQRLRSLLDQVLGDDGASIRTCAETTRTWARGVREALRLTTALIHQERLAIEAELAQNAEYLAYRDHFRRMQQEQATVSRVARVMRELARDNSVIDRSELDQRLTTLKGSLLGYRESGWLAGRAPVEEWLQHTLRIQAQRISSFNENIRRLQTQTLQLGGDRRTAGNLDAINPTNMPPGGRAHEITCQLLETTWLDWSASLDHLGATQFMCDMVDPYLDNKVATGVIQVCRGEIGLDGRQIRDSRLIEVRRRLTQAGSNGPSYREWAQRVADKLRTIECPMPPVSVMN